MKKILFSICLILSIFILTGCDSGATTSGESSGESKTKELATYKVNEDIFIKTDDGEYRLKITGIKETKKRNEYDDTECDRSFIISYEYENISLEDDLYISSMDFKAYDKDNNSLETYEAIDYKSTDSVSTGRKSSGEMVWALNNDNNYIELEFYNNMWDSSPDCKIILEW